MSPLDIPIVIPPSNISPSEIDEKVSKFFREIGEVNPSEGAVKPSESRDAEEYEYERELLVRKGVACIPKVEIFDEKVSKFFREIGEVNPSEGAVFSRNIT